MKKYFCFLILISMAINLLSQEIILAKNGLTDYKIVFQGAMTQTNKFAVEELKTFLNLMTSADFQISPKVTDKNIIVGTDKRKLLEKINDQAFVIKTEANTIHLYGKGKYGNLYAVYEFLEKLGCRWYTAYNDIKIPKTKNLAIEPINITGHYAFPVRGMQTFFYKNKSNAGLYHYRNRQNILLPESSKYENSQTCFYPYVHAISKFINPGDSCHHLMHKQFEWIKNKKYFKTNPEFFPLDKTGKRTPNGQLCFSNCNLRKELTKNILEQLKREIKKHNTSKGIISVDINDVVYEKFCWCKECDKLVKKHNCTGGPFWDYLLEFSNKLKKLHPNIKVKTLAYQTTLMPPQNIKKIPDNIIIIFAPIHSNFIADLEDSSNKRILTALQKWGKISKNVWFWYYPNTYLSAKENFFMVPPCSNFSRLANDIKTMKELGIAGTYIEHDSGGLKYRTNFSELQSWVMLKLFQNPYQDIKPLINEFTNYYYGKAAPLMRQYLYELEALRKSLKAQKTRWKYNTNNFAYLSLQNLDKWNQMFNKMELLTQEYPNQNFHVRLNRLGLDATTIRMLAYKHKITEMNKKIKSFKNNFDQLLKKANVKYRSDKLNSWLKKMKEIASQRIVHKPLPPQFKKFPPDHIKVVYPSYSINFDKRKFIKDLDADGGIAMFDNPAANGNYGMAFYDNMNKVYGRGIYITKANIKPNVYNFYKFSKPITLSPKCMIYGGTKWKIHIYLNHLITQNPLLTGSKWDVYVSLKFEGPAYAKKSDFAENKVLCDRVILVKNNINN